MNISPTLQDTFNELPTVIVKDHAYISKKQLLTQVAQQLYPAGVTAQEQVNQVTETAVHLATTHSYNTADTPLTFPDVPFDQEGIYWMKLPTVTTDMLREAFRKAKPFLNNHKPVRTVSRQQVLNQVVQLIYGRSHSQLTDNQTTPLAEQVDHLITTRGKWIITDDRYENPLKPKLDAARSAIIDFLPAQPQPIYAADLWREATWAAYDRSYTLNPNNQQHLAALTQIVQEILTQAGYETTIRQYRYHPQPLPLPKDAAQQLATAVAQLPTLQTTHGSALLAETVDKTILTTLGYSSIEPQPATKRVSKSQVPDCEQSTNPQSLSDYQRKQLLEGELHEQTLRQAGYEAETTWLPRNKFTPNRDEGTYVFLREIRMRHDLNATIALDSKQGLRVHTPICVLDSTENSIVCLQMLGSPQAVKANWANLVTSRSQTAYIDGTYIRLKGMQSHLSLKTMLPIGWQDWILLHKQASIIHMTPDQPFYLLDNGSPEIPPTFFLMLDKALSIPLMPTWAAYLWQNGRQHKLIRLLSQQSIGYAAWKLFPNTKKWCQIITTGLKNQAISFTQDNQTPSNPQKPKEITPMSNQSATPASKQPEGAHLVTLSPCHLFPLGQIVATPGTLALAESGLDLTHYLSRHTQCDWGDLDPQDTAANNQALKDGTRLFSAYETEHGKLWIITEADRSATTFLLPSEY